MKLGFFGMGYVGRVYSAWAAMLGHSVTAYGKQTDTDKIEPPLMDLITDMRGKGRMTCIPGPNPTADDWDAVWITHQTPILPDGTADVAWVKEQILRVAKLVLPDTLIIISSQVPVGTIADLEAARPDRMFCYIPENVRIGRGLEYLRYPDRFILGTRRPEDTAFVNSIVNSNTAYLPNPTRVITMSPESAEMSKHMLNAFLATCISFANEAAELCHAVNADPDAIHLALKTEWRIGANLPLRPGGPFKSGHLERDLHFLDSIAFNNNLYIPVLAGAMATNDRLKEANLLAV